MRPKRTIALCGTLVLLLFVFVASARAAEPVSQIIANYADILKANPMPAGEKAQSIPLAGDATATLFLARFAPGFEVKTHFHKTHSETLYVIEGTGKMVMDGKETDISPGTIIHIPMGTVHSARITGSGELIGFQIFAPAWTEPDRVPVP